MLVEENISDRDMQEKLRNLVNREIYYCISQLIAHLAKDTDNEYYDDIVAICINNDYESAARDNNYIIKKDNLGYFIWVENTQEIDQKESQQSFNTELEAWKNCCEVNEIKPYQSEAYEHWLVSNWLAQKLADNGEMVSMDIHGLTVWGRTITGETIYEDPVIKEICKSLA